MGHPVRRRGVLPGDRGIEIAPVELAFALERGEALQIVDVRAPERVRRGHLDLVPAERFHNIRGSVLLARRSLEDTGLDPALPVVVVCDRGRDSQVAARHLRRLGSNARSLAGGWSAWARLTLPRVLEPSCGLDHFVQFDRLAKGALGYLLVSDGEALVVDPPLDATAYLEAAAARGAEVVGVADTHVHADYVSGAPRLARALGVPYYLHAADSVYPYDGTPGRLEFRAVHDGEAIRVGRSTVRVRHTPGHTEGSVTYLVDRDLALTGDFLFVGSIGRPDLAGKTAAWTDELWRSVSAAKREWPRALRIYPAHYAGETERNADRSVGAAFGSLRSTNPSLRMNSREAFRAWVAQRAAPFPEVYKTIKAVNVGLIEVSDEQAAELEVGRSECALGGPLGGPASP
jgi:glyoxylase-like metal-dependent hydrolase (beta-lactamase superfamily II)